MDIKNIIFGLIVAGGFFMGGASITKMITEQNYGAIAQEYLSPILNIVNISNQEEIIQNFNNLINSIIGKKENTSEESGSKENNGSI